MAPKPRIMYIECKRGLAGGEARIGRVTFTRTGRTLHYGGKNFLKVKGYKYNHIEQETGEHYWISGPRRDGTDRLYGERIPIEIDDDVREDYWRDIRGMPEMVEKRSYW